ncbi:hypothetical protein K438DRAFT_1762109 [Mycena galopus ATCC 62051]|nr:hypothetical protein K438DRAFT_1762109 [Mycena galopus ATCC 62051]
MACVSSFALYGPGGDQFAFSTAAGSGSAARPSKSVRDISKKGVRSDWAYHSTGDIKSPSSAAAARIGPRENYASSNIHIAPEMIWQSVPAPGIELRFECLNEIEYCFGNCFPVTLPIQPLSTVEVRQRRRGRLHLERSNSPKRRYMPPVHE